MVHAMKYVFLCTLYLIIDANEDCPIVSTPLGKLMGTTLQSRLGKTIFSYRGIRYAQAPVGSLRFMPPVPIEYWNGTYNATADGPVCPQPTDEISSEDCLILNVYSTKLPDVNGNPKRPVIVFFHAGGYYSGTSITNWSGPQYFMDQDIVLVTANYRLGTLGFLSLGTKESPGNNGLKDQVQALKWIRQNIISFGGDSDNISILGYSVGAMSAILHMMSPMSRGLFHKVIAMSYSPLGQLPIRKNQVYLAKKQARLVGCPDDSIEKMYNCLKTVSYERLGNSLEGFQEFGTDPIMIWTPVIEEDFGQDRFLTDHPINLVTSGRFMKVPVLTGVTEHEFGYKAFDVIENRTLRNEINNNFEKIAPIAFCFERNTEFSRNVSEGLRKFYLNNQEIDDSKLNGLSELYADSVIGYSVNRAAKLISMYSNKPVYYYRFSYRGRYSHFYIPGTNNTRTYGAVHHDELIYLFYVGAVFPLFEKSSPPEVKMVSKLTSMWANFAKYGKPIPDNKDFHSIQWTPFTTKDQHYMDIGENLVLKKYLYKQRYLEWEKLFPISHYEVFL